MIKFDLPKNQSSIIKVLGVGGGGSNAVNHMFKLGIQGVDFVVCNTDAQALDLSPVPNKIQLGVNLTEGRGAGSIPSVGRNAAIEDVDMIKESLSKNTKMLFITAGMGGGTGTGAAPIIAQASKELGILTVGIVTIPFSWEGRKRRQQAEEGISEMKEHVDTLLIVCNDKLRELYGNMSFSEAFAKADNVLATGAKGIAEIITLTGNINVDFADVRTVMSDSGVAIMGSGSAEGEGRAEQAVEMALASPLLNDNNIKGANKILLNITSGQEEILMDEITEITEYIQVEAGSAADIIWGLGKDDSLGKKINVTVVATGFGQNADLGYELSKPAPKKVVIPLNEKSKTNTVENDSSPADQEIDEVEGMKLIKKSGNKAENKSNSPDSNNYIFDFDVKTSKDPSFKQDDVKPGTTNNPDTRIDENSQEEYDSVSKEEMDVKAKEREQKLRELSLKLKTPEGLAELEKQPAFIRRKVELSKVPQSSESQISRYVLKESNNKVVQIKSNNSFLHDNVD